MWYKNIQQNEIHSQLEEMLKFAHVNYDKKKISFRRDKKIGSEEEKNEVKKRGALKLRQKLLETQWFFKEISVGCGSVIAMYVGVVL